MSASPEVAKQNGKKSPSPTTERGKAISARNSTKQEIDYHFLPALFRH